MSLALAWLMPLALTVVDVVVVNAFCVGHYNCVIELKLGNKNKFI